MSFVSTFARYHRDQGCSREFAYRQASVAYGLRNYVPPAVRVRHPLSVALGRKIRKAAASDASADEMAELLTELADNVSIKAARAVMRSLDSRDLDCIKSVVECSGCDTFLDSEGGNCTRISGDHYCDGCRDEKFSICDCCDEWVSTDDICTLYRESGRDRAMCETCLHNGDYYQWDSDDEWHDTPEPEPEPEYGDSGPSQRSSAAWKWLNAKCGQGKTAVQMPNNGIANEGMQKIRDEVLWPLVKEQLPKEYCFCDCGDPGCSRGHERFANRFNLWMEDHLAERNTDLVEWVTNRGTLPKRLSKWLYEAEWSGKLKMPPNVVSAIGDTARAYCPKQSRFLYDVTGEFGWRAGAFGDSGSCYWTCRSCARMQLEAQHNAFAVRFYEPDNPGIGVGRCWVLVDDEKAFLFNAYGPHGLLTITRMLAQEMGANYRACKLSNYDSSGGKLWLNNDGRGYCIGYAANSESLPETWDFELEIPDSEGD